MTSSVTSTGAVRRVGIRPETSTSNEPLEVLEARDTRARKVDGSSGSTNRRRKIGF